MANFGFKISIKEDVTENLNVMTSRLSPRHLTYMNRNIVARIMHADVTSHFYNQGPRWAPLSPLYAKIKKGTSLAGKTMPNRQPKDLGAYPTPWGKIGVRYGELFGSLGTVLRITPHTVFYGTTAPHAKDFNDGSTVSRMHLYARNGRGYYKDLRKPIKIVGRPFMWVSSEARSAITTTLQDYVTAPKKARRVVIPHLGYTILGSGGRNVPILYSRN